MTPRNPPAIGLALVLVLGAAGCGSPTVRIEGFHEAWSRGDMARVESAIDALIAQQSRADAEVVHATNGLAAAIDQDLGDTALYMLEKSMVSLAQGDFDSAIDLMRRGRDALEPRHASLDMVAIFASIMLDDLVMPYAGRDYEHLALRSLLTVADLVGGEGDAYAYALQISEKQEQILGTPFGLMETEDGEVVGYDVREHYDRLAVGAYLEGVVHEGRGDFDEARKAYERAAEWSAPEGAVADALATCRGEVDVLGTGLVHVFYLPGRSPRLFTTEYPVTDEALELAHLGALYGSVPHSPLLHAPVRVPNVISYDADPAPLAVTVDGVERLTETLLDVNAIAKAEHDALLPWTIARAATRRAFKTYGAAATAAEMRAWGNHIGAWWVEGVASLSTSGEQADTRNWTTLPAELQVARLRLQEGEHELHLSNGDKLGVRVRAGGSSYVMVLRPSPRQPGFTFVDPASAVRTPGPEEPSGATGE